MDGSIPSTEIIILNPPIRFNIFLEKIFEKIFEKVLIPLSVFGIIIPSVGGWAPTDKPKGTKK